jgi:hypothetical protein
LADAENIVQNESRIIYQKIHEFAKKIAQDENISIEAAEEKIQNYIYTYGTVPIVSGPPPPPGMKGPPPPPGPGMKGPPPPPGMKGAPRPVQVTRIDKLTKDYNSEKAEMKNKIKKEKETEGVKLKAAELEEETVKRMVNRTKDYEKAKAQIKLEDKYKDEEEELKKRILLENPDSIGEELNDIFAKEMIEVNEIRKLQEEKAKKDAIIREQQKIEAEERAQRKAIEDKEADILRKKMKKSSRAKLTQEEREKAEYEDFLAEHPGYEEAEPDIILDENGNAIITKQGKQEIKKINASNDFKKYQERLITVNQFKKDINDIKLQKEKVDNELNIMKEKLEEAQANYLLIKEDEEKKYFKNHPGEKKLPVRYKHNNEYNNAVTLKQNINKNIEKLKEDIKGFEKPIFSLDFQRRSALKSLNYYKRKLEVI